MTPENIDEKFCEAMRSIGGVRPTEVVPAAGLALNADVVFQRENIVLEIKTLMSDPSERAHHIDKVSEIYRRWVGRPGVPLIFGRQPLSTQDVPEEMGFELVRSLADPIRTAVTKANRQIRQVKESLGMHDAHGVLLLCNAGATTLTPHVVLHALHHALGKRHSSINSAIFMTHGVPVQVSGMPEAAEVFGTLNRDGHPPLSDDLGGRIQRAWLEFQARTIQQPIRVYSGVDEKSLMDATNATHRPAGTHPPARSGA